MLSSGDSSHSLHPTQECRTHSLLLRLFTEPISFPRLGLIGKWKVCPANSVGRLCSSHRSCLCPGPSVSLSPILPTSSSSHRAESRHRAPPLNDLPVFSSDVQMLEAAPTGVVKSLKNILVPQDNGNVLVYSVEENPIHPIIKGTFCASVTFSFRGEFALPYPSFLPVVHSLLLNSQYFFCNSLNVRRIDSGKGSGDVHDDCHHGRREAYGVRPRGLCLAMADQSRR